MPTTAQATLAYRTPNYLLLLKLADRISRLNTDAGEIGAGMLATIVDEAHRALGDGTTASNNAEQDRMARLRELADPAGPTGNLAEILGIPCFRCIYPAQALRMGGHTIARKAEAEQAATLHYLVRMYIEHGADWWNEARAELTGMTDAAEAKIKAAEGTPA